MDGQTTGEEFLGDRIFREREGECERKVEGGPPTLLARCAEQLRRV